MKFTSSLCPQEIVTVKKHLPRALLLSGTSLFSIGGEPRFNSPTPLPTFLGQCKVTDYIPCIRSIGSQNTCDVGQIGEFACVLVVG